MSYKDGFRDGWNAAMERFGPHQEDLSFEDEKRQFLGSLRPNLKAVRKKRKQSGKQKILTQMAKKAWDKYKKGNGKKSYIDIRAQVSRSQAYKKKTKGM